MIDKTSLELYVNNVSPYFPASIRTQTGHGRPGQCGQNHNSLPIPDERGGAHQSDHRVERRRGIHTQQLNVDLPMVIFNYN